MNRLGAEQTRKFNQEGMKGAADGEALLFDVANRKKSLVGVNIALPITVDKDRLRCFVKLFDTNWILGNQTYANPYSLLIVPSHIISCVFLLYSYDPAINLTFEK